MSSHSKEVAEMIMPVFVEESFKSRDTTGKFRIPDQVRREIGASLDLTPGQTAAYSYLAEHRAEDEAFELELDTSAGVWGLE